jgi:hypothetical protein
MTPDSSALSSLCSLEFPLNVLTADGTSLSDASRDTLSIPFFSVPDVSHFPRLTMNLFSAAQIINSGCRVILDVDSCFVRCTEALVGAGPRRRDSPGLWDLDWFRLPSTDTSTTTSSRALATSASSSFQQWHHRLGHLCGSRLSSLVHHSLLGLV